MGICWKSSRDPMAAAAGNREMGPNALPLVADHDDQQAEVRSPQARSIRPLLSSNDGMDRCQQSASLQVHCKLGISAAS